MVASVTRSPSMLLMILLLTGGAAGHGNGSVAIDGTMQLAPAGMNGSFQEGGFVASGLPTDAGVTIFASWLADNGTGPPVEFAVHHHTTTVVYDFRHTAAVGNETWVIPSKADLWFSFENLASVSVNVSYVIDAHRPPESALWYILPVVLVGGTISAAWLASRRPRKKPPEPG